MANQEAFQAQGAIQLSLRGQSGPQLGKNYSMSGQGPIPVQGGGAPAGRPVLQQQPVASGSPISSPQAPKGAQPVALVGQPSPMGGSPMMPMAPAPMPAQPQHALGSPSPAGAPFLTKAPPQQGNVEVHTISVIGLGSDGKKYVAEFDAVFPPGTTIKEVSERMGQ